MKNPKADFLLEAVASPIAAVPHSASAAAHSVAAAVAPPAAAAAHTVDMKYITKKTWPLYRHYHKKHNFARDHRILPLEENQKKQACRPRERMDPLPKNLQSLWTQPSRFVMHPHHADLLHIVETPPHTHPPQKKPRPSRPDYG